MDSYMFVQVPTEATGVRSPGARNTSSCEHPPCHTGHQTQILERGVHSANCCLVLKFFS